MAYNIIYYIVILCYGKRLYNTIIIIVLFETKGKKRDEKRNNVRRDREPTSLSGAAQAGRFRRDTYL